MTSVTILPLSSHDLNYFCHMSHLFLQFTAPDEFKALFDQQYLKNRKVEDRSGSLLILFFHASALLPDLDRTHGK